MRWFIAIFLALVLLSALTPWLQKLGIGKLPGDFRFKLFGREVFLPVASAISTVAADIRALRSAVRAFKPAQNHE